MVYECTPEEEDALAASPVDVAYPSPEYDDLAEKLPIEESPAAEEVPIDAPTESFPAEEYPIVEELAKEPLTGEVPAEYSPVEELKADPESEALKQPDIPTGSKAEDSDRDGVEKPKE